MNIEEAKLSDLKEIEMNNDKLEDYDEEEEDETLEPRLERGKRWTEDDYLKLEEKEAEVGQTDNWEMVKMQAKARQAEDSVGKSVRERRWAGEDDVMGLSWQELDMGMSDYYRPRRAANREYTIELMVVADRKMEEFHGEDLDVYIMNLIAAVSMHIS